VKHGDQNTGLLSFEEYDKDPDMWLGIFGDMTEFLALERLEEEMAE
jgi:hypothetical protein